MAKAKRTKRRSRTGWGRFVQDNAVTAAEKAKADGGDTSYFGVLSVWWKEVSTEIKDNYNKDKDFVHKFNETTAETTAAPKAKTTAETKAETKADPTETKAATEESNEPPAEEPAEPEAAATEETTEEKA